MCEDICRSVSSDGSECTVEAQKGISMDGVGYSTTLQGEILKHAIATHVPEKKGCQF